MSRDEMIKRLESLPHPIIEDVVFSDMGCEFSILTPKKGYYCVVGSNFPIFGPFKILPGGKENQSIVIKYGEYSVPLKSISDDGIVADMLGEKNLKKLLNDELQINKSLYVFNDFGRGDVSPILSSRKAACDYFFKYYTEFEEGTPWSSMSSDELETWSDTLERWRSKREGRLIPMKYYGVCYNALSGHFGPPRLEDV